MTAERTRTPGNIKEILVVDDTPKNLMLLSDLLTGEGYKVRPTEDPRLAIESALAFPPDLILLDIRMPEMDGFEVCEKLKADDRVAKVPIIFVSALQDLRDRVRGFEVGGVDYITKPIQSEEVLARVRTHLELHSMRENLEQIVSERTAELSDTYLRISESEAKYRRLVENLQQDFFIYAHDTNGVLYYVSPSITNVLGYTQDEFSTHYAEHLTDNPINDEVERLTELAINGEEQPPYELEINHKDGAIHRLAISEVPIFNERGEVEAVEGIAHDITERYLMEEQLKAAQHIASMGNWVLDMTTDELSWSEEIYSIFGLPPEQLSASYAGFLDVVHPDDRDYVNDQYTTSVKQGIPYDIEHRIIRHSDGQIRFVHERCEHQRDAKGKVIRSIGTVQDITERKEVDDAKRLNAKKIHDTLFQTIQAIARTEEKRDPYTSGHQQRVSELAVAIGDRMGLEAEKLEGLSLGSLIHDIGKIYIPAEILNRPGKLSKPEFEMIKSHPDVGYDIVKDVEFIWPVKEMISQHHERIDGSGYPNGLRGDDIIQEARILSVADVVEAVTAHRPYRPALGIEKAIDIIKEGRGKIFDPEVVDVCIELIVEDRFKWEADD